VGAPPPEALGPYDRAMADVVFDISMSLDGFVTGPSPSIDRGLGIGGERLHDWALTARTTADAALLDETMAATGAVLMGRRTFDVVDGPRGWRDGLGYGGERSQASPPPTFVVTSSAPATVRLAGRFQFVTEGITTALQRARDAAGGKDVVIMGGANLGRQYLDAGLVDEFRIHIAPVVLTAGTPLFRLSAGPAIILKQTDVVATSAATHVTYRVIKTR
jgi:dihydrofolate reductase